MAPGAGRPTALQPGAAPRLPGEPSILLLRPDHLGDLLLTTPAVDVLRAALPQARLTLVVGPWSLPVAGRIRGIDHLAAIPFPWFDRAERALPWRSYRRLAQAVHQLARLPGAPFHAALVLRDDDYWGAWLAALAAVPVRVGHDVAGVRPFLTHVLPSAGRPQHVAAQAMALVAALLCQKPEPWPLAHPLRVRVDDSDRRLARDVLGRAARAHGCGWPPAGLLAVHPASGAAVKQWRPGAWRDVLAALARPEDLVVVTGTAGDRPLVAELMQALAGRPALDLAGLTDLGGLAAVYESCRLVMGPDSGPLHLGVAVGTPTVHLFGPADVRRFGPWGPTDRHEAVVARQPCAPCGRLDWPDVEDHPCIRTMAVEPVVAAATRVLGRA